MQILVNSNIRQAIKILNKHGAKTIIVVNDNGRLVGTLSDGDIRKSIIKGFNLKSSINNIYNKKPIFIHENKIDKKKIRKIFLKEKITLITLISIILGMCGVFLILGSSLSIQSSDQFLGNIVAFIMPISFAILVIIVRKYPNVDMVPAQFTAGVFAAFIGFLIADKISISLHDIILASLAGFFQIGFGFILITLGSQTTPAAVVGVLMLTESVFGPFWAWLFINEIPPFGVLIGGGIIIFSILLQTFLNKNQ